MNIIDKDRTLILNSAEINTKIERIAYEIHEQNYDQEEIVLIGIKNRGLILAQKLMKQLQNICSITINIHSLNIDKHTLLTNQIVFDPPIENFRDKTIIFVDDVANTGRVMLYAIQPILEHFPKKIQIAVLVDRQHKLFPISPDYVGLALSTSWQENVVVEFIDGKEAVYLD